MTTFIDQLFDLVFQSIVSLLRFCVEFLEVLFTGKPKRNTAYTADFGAVGSLLSRWNKGFRLTGARSLTVKDSYQNALIVGGTGTGKSSVTLVPSAFEMPASLVVHDPNGELFTKTAGYKQSQGYAVKVLDFARPTRSCGYNPLVRARSSSDIQKVAAMLVDNAMGQKAKDPFWNTLATSLLAVMIAVLNTQEERYRNLFNVRHLLNALGSHPKAVDLLFSRHADEALFAEYRSFIAYDDKVVNGVIATAKAALQLFTDEALAQVTSTDTLDFESFRTRPTVLYIQNSVADQKYYSVLTSILFEQFFAYVLGRFPKDGEQDIFLLVDEASSLNLPTLPLAVANVRKHRCGVMLLVQDFAQLVHHYGRYDADAIRANCFAKMYFTGQSLETAKELEQTLGKYEYDDEHGKKVIRPLMTNDEIRTMKAGRALLICGNHAPIVARLKPYYKKASYRRFSSFEPPAPEGASSEGPHLLKLEEPVTAKNHRVNGQTHR